ncbi:hypothetical protein SLEP1_g24870 [Rubroshorea leprosula]|uniref:Mechanosensitive ion channel MscS domain-containing protein n=1 Tax=Rubroshorea leprosula TaxID=152421 RepID=A0AAV5JMC6_9ROSI|nr:hypothetical protein SLEP1_g24870 [Rubroshorea leprosula]
MTVQNLINELDRGKEDPGVISRLLNIDPKEVSAWTMEDIIDSIRSNKLSSITEELENLIDDEDFRAKLEYEDKVPELDTVADLIFSKMNPPSDSPLPNSNSGSAPHEKRINKDNLKRSCSFGEKEAVAVIQQINGQKLVPRHFHHPSKNQTNKVSCQALKMWLVHATVERRTLVQSINDMKCAIKELNELFSGIVLILLIVIWSLMIGLLTREGLVLILSQLFFLTFMFGNTAKSAFEGIIFVFVKHPFDIGDLCLINREKMVVERINLLTTVFRKNNKDKVLYSNSVLSTIPIRNFYSGNVHTRDSLEFTIKWPTVLDEEIIKSLRRRIKKRLGQDQNKKWFPECDLVVKELEDEQRAKIVLYVTCCNENVHRSGVTMISLRHELIIALNRILRDLKIEHYEIRPQETDRMKNTAKPRSTQKRNQQSNEGKNEESKTELNEETETETEEEENTYHN